MKIKILYTGVKESPYLGGKEMWAMCEVEEQIRSYTTSELQAMKNFADEDCLKSIEYGLGLMIMIEFCWKELDNVYCNRQERKEQYYGL